MLKKLTYKHLNFAGQLFYEVSSNHWKGIKVTYNLKDNQKCYYFQIIHRLPKMWKQIILKVK